VKEHLTFVRDDAEAEALCAFFRTEGFEPDFRSVPGAPAAIAE
jgi:hypothetical protein